MLGDVHCVFELQNMVVCLELVNIALDNSLSTPHDFNLNLNLGGVDGHPPPIVRLLDAQHYAQMLSYFIMDISTILIFMPL